MSFSIFSILLFISSIILLFKFSANSLISSGEDALSFTASRPASIAAIVASSEDNPFCNPSLSFSSKILST